ncbi:unnamed protein product [Cylindrotheca closterium]|uniref:DUF6824 domain-containing protein n=1 Tax=Cylindrotheca closterium TaxID=2856 RepID=A0AAD2FSK9_9STRA|nr:unnamed protein product [Cylindrotheca closterium]
MMNALPATVNIPERITPNDVEEVSSRDGKLEEPAKRETEQERHSAMRNHHQIRSADAAADPTAERVSKLHKKDVMLGRGYGIQNHPGNERMRDIIAKYKPQYHSMTREGKRKLIEGAYNEITESGAKFLKKLDGKKGWAVVDRVTALNKIRQSVKRRKNAAHPFDEENWNKPTTFGGFAGPGARALAGMPSALEGMPSAMAGMPIPGAMRGMPPALSGIPGAIPGSMPGATPGSMPGATPGSMPGAIPGAIPLSISVPTPASLPSLVAPSSRYAPPARAAEDMSLAALEAQRMAALQRYRMITGSIAAATTRQDDMEYYQNLRRQQETRLLMEQRNTAEVAKK